MDDINLMKADLLSSQPSIQSRRTALGFRSSSRKLCWYTAGIVFKRWLTAEMPYER